MRKFASPISTISFGRLDAWIIAAVIVGTLLRIIQLDTATLWFDETLTASWVTLPWNDMLAVVLTDNHLPLYFVLIKAWTGIFGDSALALRSFSVPFSVATILIIAATAKILSDRATASWAAWLAALSPYLLQHGQEARMYALLGFLAALNILLMARFVSGKSKHLEAGFLAVNTALLATHYYAIFLIAVELPILFLLERNRLRAWLPALVASCVLFIMLVLAAKYLATPHAGGAYHGLKIIGLPGMVWGLLAGYTLMPSSSEMHDQGLRAILPYLPIASMALVALVLTLWRGLQTLSRPAWILLLGVLAGVLFPPLLMSNLFDIGINPRYAMTGAPAFIILVAAGLAHSVHQSIGKACAIGLLGLTTYASYLHLEDPGHGRENIAAAQAWLDQNVPNKETILITSSEFTVLTNFFWPHRRFIHYPVSSIVITQENINAIANAIPFAENGRVIFMIGREWISDPDDLLIPALEKRYGNCGGASLRGVRILCLTPRPTN